MSNDNILAEFDDMWNNSIFNNSTHDKFDDLWNNASQTIADDFLGCIQAKDIFKCLNLLGNDTQPSSMDPSKDEMYEELCAMFSQEIIINSSSGFEKEIPLLNGSHLSSNLENEVLSFPATLFYNMHYLIDVIGVASNLVLILVIILNRRFWKPFYMSILSLGVSDVLFLVNYFVDAFLPRMDMCEYRYHEMYLDISYYSVKMFSKLNVVLLATVRYVMFVYPLKSRIHLTNRLIVTLSTIVMIVSIGYGTLMRFISFTVPLSKTWSVYIIDDVILLLVLVVLNLVFLFRRFRVLKTSQAAQAAHGLKFRMTLVVIIILVLHALNASFTILGNIWRFRFSNDVEIVRADIPGMETSFKFASVVDTFEKITHSVNPFLFFFSSPIVTKGVLSLLKKCNLKK
jgi:hypothetical protein